MCRINFCLSCIMCAYLFSMTKIFALRGSFSLSLFLKNRFQAIYMHAHTNTHIHIFDENICAYTPS